MQHSTIVIVDKCNKDPLPPLKMTVPAINTRSALLAGLECMRMVTQMVPVPEDLSLLTITIENIKDSVHGISGVVVKCLELPFTVEVEGVSVVKTLGPFFRDPVTFQEVTHIDGTPIYGDLASVEMEH